MVLRRGERGRGREERGGERGRKEIEVGGERGRRGGKEEIGRERGRRERGSKGGERGWEGQKEGEIERGRVEEGREVGRCQTCTVELMYTYEYIPGYPLAVSESPIQLPPRNKQTRTAGQELEYWTDRNKTQFHIKLQASQS